MYEKLRGIVLNTIRYSDKHNIVHIYTDVHGLMSFAVPLGKTQAARMRNALLMPLSLVDMEAATRHGRELAVMREVRRNYPLATIYGDPVKNAIALFISELLAHVIQEPEGNEPLFRYIEQSVQLLEQMPGQVANFHICFLYHLGAHLGIMPNLETYRKGRWFDMTDGVFTTAAVGGHAMLQPQEAQVIYLLSRMTFSNMAVFRFNREERNRMLDVIINYYRLHNAAIGTLRSPDILKQLFV
ncbi:MAG: DNA repair protein RecO, partial [Muribaculaceae bacterium]|nr:DNA repair protein RecO [Muribaculaceae bacterium]